MHIWHTHTCTLHTHSQGTCITIHKNKYVHTPTSTHLFFKTLCAIHRWAAVACIKYLTSETDRPARRKHDNVPLFKTASVYPPLRALAGVDDDRGSLLPTWSPLPAVNSRWNSSVGTPRMDRLRASPANGDSVTEHRRSFSDGICVMKASATKRGSLSVIGLWLITLTGAISEGGRGREGSVRIWNCSGEIKSRRSKISGWLHTCVCMCVCVYVFMYVCMYIHTCTDDCAPYIGPHLVCSHCFKWERISGQWHSSIQLHFDIQWPRAYSLRSRTLESKNKPYIHTCMYT
jgi:hypothetical protein